jgi:hypothetical protein
MIHGCPVLPRWGLSGSPTNTVLVAAYLNQAIVLRGHHQDLEKGVEVLDDIARYINGLGKVEWGPMHRLARLNYQWKMDGTTCRVFPQGRNLDLRLPPDAEAFVLDRNSGDNSAKYAVELSESKSVKFLAGENVKLGHHVNGHVRVRAVNGQPAPGAGKGMGVKGGAVIRRVLTESRDRLQRWL